MSEDLFATLDPPYRVLKRAQYEAFAFSLVEGGVYVRNESHLHPEDHEYRVTVTDGIPTSCECPADAGYDWPCKHRVAVAVRPRLLEIVTTMQAVATAGDVAALGRPFDGATGSNDSACDCADLPDDFPCWECVRTGRRNLPE